MAQTVSENCTHWPGLAGSADCIVGGIERIIRIELGHGVSRIVRVKPIRGVQGIVWGILVHRIEDAIVAFILRVKALLAVCGYRYGKQDHEK